MLPQMAWEGWTVRLRVTIEGFQVYREYVGEVLAWSTSVERFGDTLMQVPCVMIDTGSHVEALALRTEHTWCSKMEQMPTPMSPEELQTVIDTRRHT